MGVLLQMIEYLTGFSFELCRVFGQWCSAVISFSQFDLYGFDALHEHDKCGIDQFEIIFHNRCF